MTDKNLNFTLTILIYLFISCSYTTNFEKKELDYSIFIDAPPEILIPCNDDCDCTALGPCRRCIASYCVLPEGSDKDGDGYFDSNCPVETSCAISKNLPERYWPKSGDDCDDKNRLVHPGAPELCNGIDDNCDGWIDDDPRNFGPAGESPVKLTDGFSLDFCPLTESTLVVWQENYSRGTKGIIKSGFIDINGNLFNPNILSDSGSDPRIECIPGNGAIVSWNDIDYGNTDIVIHKLDLWGTPVQGYEAQHFPNDTYPSRNADIAYSGNVSAVAVIWFTYDTNVTGRVNIRIFDYYNLTSNSAIINWTFPEPPNQPLQLPIIENTASFLKTKIKSFPLPHGWLPDSSNKGGFCAAFNAEGGIYFACFVCNRTGSSMNCQNITEIPLLVVENSNVRYLDMEWTGKSFFIVYNESIRDEESYMTNIKFINLIPLDFMEPPAWQLKEVEIKKRDGYPAYELFGRLLGFPSIKKAEGDEIALIWTEEESFSTRKVKFTRFKIDDESSDYATTLTLVMNTMNFLDISLPDKFAGPPILEYISFPGSEGFLAGWTEPSILENSVIYTRMIKCIKQETR